MTTLLQRIGAVAFVACGFVLAGQLPGAAAAAPRAITYDHAFWQWWSDGQAELAGYEITYTRYGTARTGTAVTVFVKEDFGNPTRVKVDPSKHPADETFPVMKLNLVQDFATGVYDYNLMTSAFLALHPVNGRPAGTLTKVVFSAQEWCGQTFHELLFDSVGVREISHSYFDGEADQAGTLDYPADGVSEDALLLWARGMAEPVLEPGERVERPLLMSAERARLRHTPVAWRQAWFSREHGDTVTVPAGDFAVDLYIVAPAPRPVKGGWWMRIAVERAAPHRIVQWKTSDGFTAKLLNSQRMAYWQKTRPGDEDALRGLGLTPRPPRTP